MPSKFSTALYFTDLKKDVGGCILLLNLLLLSITFGQNALFFPPS